MTGVYPMIYGMVENPANGLSVQSLNEGKLETKVAMSNTVERTLTHSIASLHEEGAKLQSEFAHEILQLRDQNANAFQELWAAVGLCKEQLSGQTAASPRRLGATKMDVHDPDERWAAMGAQEKPVTTTTQLAAGTASAPLPAGGCAEQQKCAQIEQRVEAQGREIASLRRALIEMQARLQLHAVHTNRIALRSTYLSPEDREQVIHSLEKREAKIRAAMRTVLDSSAIGISIELPTSITEEQLATVSPQAPPSSIRSCDAEGFRELASLLC